MLRMLQVVCIFSVGYHTIGILLIHSIYQATKYFIGPKSSTWETVTITYVEIPTLPERWKAKWDILHTSVDMKSIEWVHVKLSDKVPGLYKVNGYDQAIKDPHAKLQCVNGMLIIVHNSFKSIVGNILLGGVGYFLHTTVV